MHAQGTVEDYQRGESAVCILCKDPDQDPVLCEAFLCPNTVCEECMTVKVSSAQKPTRLFFCTRLRFDLRVYWEMLFTGEGGRQS